MAKKNENRAYISIECSECKKYSYNVSKNKKNTPDKLAIKKACPVCGKHTVFKEKK